MKAAFGFAVLVLVIMLWLYLERRRVRHQVEATFKGRASLSDEEFFARYYSESGISKDTVNGVRQVLGDELQVDISRVIPADSFAGNLHFLLDSDSMADIAIVQALEKRFSITISDLEAERTRTVGEIISFIHGKTTPA
jgi:acyl carrier protein